MNAEQYLNEALGGNMNISTLKPLAWHEIMEGYAQHKLAEAVKTSHNEAQQYICLKYPSICNHQCGHSNKFCDNKIECESKRPAGA